MSTRKVTIPPTSTQPMLFTGALSDRLVFEARGRLLGKLKAAVQVFNGEIVRLESTGDLVDQTIEKAYEALAWAVDGFREEQEIAAMDLEVSL